MTRFLLWNVHQKPLQVLAAQLVRERGVDVAILIECANPSDFAAEFSRATGHGYTHHNSVSNRVRIVSRLLASGVEMLEDEGRFTFCRVRAPGGVEISLVGLHGLSKLHASEADQMGECFLLRQRILYLEEQVAHQRTVVVGDFNMNPWEMGMIATVGLNAVASREVAARRARRVQGSPYGMFYNPMWRFLGDRPGAAPGTYYYGLSRHTGFFWNMFDQVLLRPDLLPRFDDESAAIVTRIGAASLLRNGRPNARLASDHLPVVFDLDLREESDDG